MPLESICFKGHVTQTLHPTPLSPQDSGHPTPKRESAKWRGRATKWWGQEVKQVWAEDKEEEIQEETVSLTAAKETSTNAESRK